MLLSAVKAIVNTENFGPESALAMPSIPEVNKRLDNPAKIFNAVQYCTYIVIIILYQKLHLLVRKVPPGKRR